MRNRFILTNHMLALALAAAYPVAAHAADGIAQFTAGDATVTRGAGAAMPLTKGREVASGDLLATGQGGQMQVRFSDGGLVALPQNSKLLMRQYVDAND